MSQTRRSAEELAQLFRGPANFFGTARQRRFENFVAYGSRRSRKGADKIQDHPELATRGTLAGSPCAHAAGDIICPSGHGSIRARGGARTIGAMGTGTAPFARSMRIRRRSPCCGTTNEWTSKGSVSPKRKAPLRQKGVRRRSTSRAAIRRKQRRGWRRRRRLAVRKPRNPTRLRQASAAYMRRWGSSSPTSRNHGGWSVVNL